MGATGVLGVRNIQISAFFEAVKKLRGPGMN